MLEMRWQAVPQMRFLEQCMSCCLRNEAGDGHFQTEGECHLPGTLVCYQIIIGTPDIR